jgi:hypothetical protein
MCFFNIYAFKCVWLSYKCSMYELLVTWQISVRWSSLFQAQVCSERIGLSYWYLSCDKRLTHRTFYNLVIQTFLATDPEARVRFPALPEKKKVVGLERGPLTLVSTSEELLDRKVAAPVYKTENTARGIRHADHVAPIHTSWQSLRRQVAVARSV